MSKAERERRIKNGESIRAKERVRRTNNIEIRRERERTASFKYRSKPGQKEKRSRRLRNKKEQAHKGRVNTCRICGTTFHPEYGKHSWRGTCSITCSEEQERRRKRRKNGTYKARKKTNVIELFDPIDVLNRDRWTCQLCGCKTPRKLRGTIKDHAPEVDHIVPLAEGGEHSMRNAQCLCRHCNLEKGATTRGQLRLFG